MQRFSASPIEMAMSIWRNRSLIFQMTKREVRDAIVDRYWDWDGRLFHPLVMLTIYTFVFSVVFRAQMARHGRRQHD